MAVRIAVRRRAGRRVSLTPLIDVVFILLVFFMLETTFLREGGVQIAAPAPGGQAPRAGYLTIELFDMDYVWIDDRRVAFGQWRESLAAVAAPGEVSVALRAGGDVSVQRVVELLDTLRDQGFRDVTVGATRGFRP
jgi:biopolymer transport protein ExbD